MSCETCGTIEAYGKRVKKGKRVCIDCWKIGQNTETEDKQEAPPNDMQ